MPACTLCKVQQRPCLLALATLIFYFQPKPNVPEGPEYENMSPRQGKLQLIAYDIKTASPVHTMKLLSATQCCRQKFHGVYVRETCFKRFLEYHVTVSSHRTLLYFLKLVCNFCQVYDYFLGQFRQSFIVCIGLKWSGKTSPLEIVRQKVGTETWRYLPSIYDTGERNNNSVAS